MIFTYIYIYIFQHTHVLRSLPVLSPWPEGQVTILGKIMLYIVIPSFWHGDIMYWIKIINPPNAILCDTLWYPHSDTEILCLDQNHQSPKRYIFFGNIFRTNIEQISIICLVRKTVSVYIHQALKYPKIANVYHGSLNVPFFHITQPLGIWSTKWLLFLVMSNIPKSWDIYQPLFMAPITGDWYPGLDSIPTFDGALVRPPPSHT